MISDFEICSQTSNSPFVVPKLLLNFHFTTVKKVFPFTVPKMLQNSLIIAPWAVPEGLSPLPPLKDRSILTSGGLWDNRKVKLSNQSMFRIQGHWSIIASLSNFELRIFFEFSNIFELRKYYRTSVEAGIRGQLSEKVGVGIVCSCEKTPLFSLAVKAGVRRPDVLDEILLTQRAGGRQTSAHLTRWNSSHLLVAQLHTKLRRAHFRFCALFCSFWVQQTWLRPQ